MGSKKKSKAKRKAAEEAARRRAAEAARAQCAGEKQKAEAAPAAGQKEAAVSETGQGAEAVPVAVWKETAVTGFAAEKKEHAERKASWKQKWFTAKKETKCLWIAGTAAGVLLLAVIVSLLLQIHSLSQQLETVQAMSESLQLELKSVKAVTEERMLSAEGEVKPPVTPLLTKVPEPTDTPVPTPAPVVEKYLVCVDAGHGGRDSGAVYEYEDGTMRYEKEDNLWMSLKFKEALEAYGVKVIMTREDDTFLALYERTDFANSMDVDALISFHRNAAYYTNNEVNETIQGAEIWIHSSRPAGAEQLAEDMLASIVDVGGMKSRGVKSGSMSNFNEDYAINRRAVMTSMIVEMGFITSPEENDVYTKNGEAYAAAMAKAVYNWLEAQEDNK